MNWSSWLDLRLRVLWKQRDVPMMDLCERLGFDRETVLKRVDELGLGVRLEIVSCAPPEPKTEPPKNDHIEAPPAEAPPKRLTIFDLRHGHCRWPINDPGEDYYFCGDDALPNKSYCACHHRLAHRRPYRWERELGS